MLSSQTESSLPNRNSNSRQIQVGLKAHPYQSNSAIKTNNINISKNLDTQPNIPVKPRSDSGSITSKFSNPINTSSFSSQLSAVSRGEPLSNNYSGYGNNFSKQSITNENYRSTVGTPVNFNSNLTNSAKSGAFIPSSSMRQ